MRPLRQLDCTPPRGRGARARVGEEGFMLLAVVVMVALVLIALSVAAPMVARQLRREKEVESQHRMEQYVRAIQLYQRTFPGQYPASIKALENSNNVRFLRHVYVDPLTGKADYKLIHQGEQQTKIHVFFGKELDEMAASLGSAAGMQSGGGMGAPVGGGATNVSSTNALNSGFGGATIGAGTGTSTSTPATTDASGGTSGSSGSGSTTTGTNASTGTSGTTGSSDSTGTSALGDGTLGVIVGVGTSRSGTSITQPNGQTSYETWEFWYDPNIEMLKQGVNVTGGGVSSQSASSFGQNAVTGQPNSGGAGATGSTGTSGFGSSSFGSSSFGSSSTGSSSTGSSGTSPTGTTGSTNPNSSTPNPF